MKRKLLGFAITIGLFVAIGYAASISGTLINLTAQPVDVNVVRNMGEYDRFSIQSVVSDGTPSSHTITDGLKETATVIVTTDTALLISNRAATSITVSSTTGLSGDTLTMNGIVFREGFEWNVATTSDSIASSLQATINAHPDFVATVVDNVVFASATDKGVYANVWTATTTDSTNLEISSVTFLGGIDVHTLTINGIVLTEGVDWTASASSQTTGLSISAAINANSTLNQILTATSTEVVARYSIIHATAIQSGDNNWWIQSSTPAGLGITSFSQGVTTDIDIDDDQITEASHGLTTGLQVLLSTGGFTRPTGLSGGTTYYAINVNDNTYSFATSSANAVAGTVVDITDVAGGGTFTVAPLSLVNGEAGFQWQGSNDNSNWFSVSVTSVTYSSATATVGWDFGEYNYKYLRLNLTGPSSGGLGVVVTLNGRK